MLRQLRQMDPTRSVEIVLFALLMSGGNLTVRPVCAESTEGAPQVVDYITQIKPLLRERCCSCHGSLLQEGGLRLDTAELAIRGGDSGRAIEPGEAAASVIVQRVMATDPAERMPPPNEGGPLTAEQIAMLQNWIINGARHPQDEQPEPDPRNHWAFRPIERPPVPPVKHREWVRNPIDAFVARRHEEHGLTPQPEANRVLLLRRLTLDLIGLPPTPEEIDAVRQDQTGDWYAPTVRRLLDDPRHGERWARHWMDVWRYSDWWGLGDQLRNSQKHIWHWRDWIIESLNNDLPFDEMVRLMLAADELHPDDLDKLRATGFLARNYFLFNRPQWMDQTVEHVSKGFLGLTMNCTRCHDHKYDPFRQVDYYRLRAFFEPYHARLDVLPGEPDLERDGIPRVFDARPEEPTYLYVRGDEKNPDKSRVIAPGLPALLEFGDLEIKPVDLPIEAWQPQRRAWVVEAHIDAAKKQVASAEAVLASADKKLAEANAAQAKQEFAAKTSPQDKASPAGRVRENDATTVVVEDFSSLDKKRWQLFGGEWVQSAGRLEQKQDGPGRAALRLIANPPQNFEATVRFTILGGSRWRSVGLSFDASVGDPTEDTIADYHEQNVYVSGVAGGSKVHAAYNDAGTWHYPQGGAVRMLPIALNREYKLQVRVRERVINASLDGELVIACATPLARRDGLMQLTTFDALVAFHEVTISVLDPKVELHAPESIPQAASSPAVTPAVALAEHRVAEASLALARAELAAVEHRGKAWQSVWKNDVDEVRHATHAEAVRAERLRAVAQAQQGLAAAERGVVNAAPDKQDAAHKAVQTAREALDKAVAATAAEIRADDPIAQFVGAKWTPTRFLSSGGDDPAPEFAPQSTGRRSALARWITDRRNPLTARVAVNHLWLRHMGEPLVPTVFDLGRKGTPPTHPELLDWLATELMESGWSMKHVHRLIVESAVYRLSSSSADAAANVAKDADNLWLWRRTPGRLESQAVRDSLLDLAGMLDQSRGGPPVPQAQQAESKRRSLYFFHSNNERNLFLSMFDEALVTECYRREQSIVPQQALAMTNSQLVLDLSKPIAERIAAYRRDAHPEATGNNDETFIRAAFLVLLAVEPTGDEVSAGSRSLAAWRELPEAGEGEAATSFAQANLVWVLLNHNDFITIR